MRAILICLLVVLVLAAAGWLVFDFSGNRASVEVRTEKIESDTHGLVEGAKGVMDRVGEVTQDPSRPKDDSLPAPVSN